MNFNQIPFQRHKDTHGHTDTRTCVCVRSFVLGEKTGLIDACTFSRTLRSRSFLHPMGAIGIFFIREKIVEEYIKFCVKLEQ